MFDTYLNSVSKNGCFHAGFGICSLSESNQPVFLFTTLRILRVTCGEAGWKIGKNVYRIKKGDIIAVNNSDARQFVSVKNFQSEIFAFMPSVFAGESQCLKLFFARNETFNPVVNQNMSDVEEINMLLDLIKKEFQKKPMCEASKCFILSMICAVCSKIISGMKEKNPGIFEESGSKRLRGAEAVAKAIHYVNENISESFDVLRLASQLNLSRGYFTRIFKKYTGMAPAEFINRCRVNKAVSVMTEKNSTVTDAAFESGFSSLSGFYKTFHTVYNTSPGRYLRTLNAD